MYKCINCNQEVSEEDLRERIRCPFCGFRILQKTRAPIIKRVKAR